MDRISALPQDTIDKILTLMPLRDAGRTSILSRKWRYCWTSMPRLAFNVLKLSSSNNKEFNKLKIVKDIFHILILHVGPILEFSISMYDTEFAHEIEPIILHLSRSNNIKKFHFLKTPDDCYKLPCSFFSLQKLEHLDLMGCIIEPPVMFNGFSMLRSLCLHSCIITVEILQRFLTNSPLLEEFTLVFKDAADCLWLNMSTFVELFKCLSSVQVLKMCRFWIKDFGACDMPEKLPTPLVHLRILVLDVRFLHHDEIFCVLCVINSSPNLEKIKLNMSVYHDACVELDFEKLFNVEDLDFEKLFNLEDHSELILDHLKELKITNFNNVAHEMKFVKLIMAKSPVLKLARLKLNRNVTADEEIKMFQDLVRRPFPRASPTADFIIERMPIH